MRLCNDGYLRRVILIIQSFPKIPEDDQKASKDTALSEIVIFSRNKKQTAVTKTTLFLLKLRWPKNKSVYELFLDDPKSSEDF